MQFFISYARVDKAFVRRLFEGLENRKGNQAWVDWEDLRPFDPSWRATLFAAIEACDTLAFIMSPASVNSGVCAQEVAYAAQHGKRLAIIVHQHVPDEIWKERLPWIEEPQWFYFETGDRFDDSVDQLLAALNVDHDYIREHTRLYIRAREWEAGGDESLLLRGADLQEAEDWLHDAGDHRPPPTPLHRRYVRESRESAVRDLTGRLADGAELAASELDPTLSVLLAVEAHRLSPSPRVERILRRGLRLPSLVFSAPGVKRACASWAATISQNGRYAAVSKGQSVRVIEIPSGCEIAALKHADGASLLEFSPSGRYLMTWENASNDPLWDRGPVRVWEMPSGSLVAEEVSDGRVVVLRFEAGERYAAVGNTAETAMVVDLETRAVLRLKHRDAVVSALTFDPSGQFLVTAQAGGTRSKRGWQIFGEKELWVWSVPRGRRIARLALVTDTDLLEFSPDGSRLLAVCAEGRFFRLRIWNVTRGTFRIRFREMGSFGFQKTVHEIAFHPLFWWNFATTCGDGVVRIIEAVESAGVYHVGEMHRLTHDGAVESVAYLPRNGERTREINTMATGSQDRTVREWVGTDEITRALHPSAVKKVRYTIDRRYLVTCTEGGGVYVWKSNYDQPAPDEIAAESLVEELSRRLRRNLTMEEWRRYFVDESYRPTFSHLASPGSLH